MKRIVPSDPGPAASERALLDSIRHSVSAHLGFELRDQQIRAGFDLRLRKIVEMPTGAGKTVTTVLPAAMIAARGKTVLVATANDYLAARDAQWLRPIYNDAGLSVAHVAASSTHQETRSAYGCNVIYGTIRQFAFDYLRHCLAKHDRGGPPVFPESPFDALIVDEADSVLIDEARTPVVITGPSTACRDSEEACFRWAAELALEFEFDVHFVRVSNGAVAITREGYKQVLATAMPAAMSALTTTEIVHALERAILVNETYRRDRHYVIRRDRIELVDEYTGRRSPQRTLSGGLHQAIEAREGLSLTPPSEQIAGITVQEFVSRFQHLSGLTATAWEVKDELRAVYGLQVVRARPHRLNRLQRLPWCVCKSAIDRRRLIAAETREMVALGRAVLIGTRTVQDSEDLSSHFDTAGIKHVVLNARQDRNEAEIVAQAGRARRVTIATNMAGRGTDIQLDRSVASAGGLHVIVSSPHAAARIDRQLIGRAGRIGDPGSARLFIAPDDELLTQVFDRSKLNRMADSRDSRRQLPAAVRRAQRHLAKQHRRERAQLAVQSEGINACLIQLGLEPLLARI